MVTTEADFIGTSAWSTSVLSQSRARCIVGAAVWWLGAAGRAGSRFLCWVMRLSRLAALRCRPAMLRCARCQRCVCAAAGRWSAVGVAAVLDTAVCRSPWVILVGAPTILSHFSWRRSHFWLCFGRGRGFGRAVG